MPFGALTHVGIAKETNWGTEAAATDYIPFVSEGINEEIEQVVSQSLKSIVDEPKSYEGLHSIAGDLTFEAYPNILGYFLTAAFGSPTTTQPDATNAPSVYEHVFTPTQTNFSDKSPLQPYTFEVHRDLEKAFQYAGSVVNDLTMSFGTDQKIMQVTASLIAKKLALITKTSPSFDTSNPFLWNQSSITINSSNNLDLETVEFSVNNSLEGKATLNGTREISRIRRTGFRTFPVSLSFSLSNLDEFNNFKAQNEIASKIEFTGDTIEDAQKYSLTIDMPKLRYTAFPINVGGAEEITTQVDGVAKYDEATAKAVQIKLVNTKASY